MVQDIFRSQFRLPYPLYEDLKKAADDNHRSLNAEIVARLEQSFADEQGDAIIDEASPELMLRLFDHARAQLAEEIKQGKVKPGLPKMKLAKPTSDEEPGEGA
nr:Arc family DNA-binding protein [Halomonas socia]